MKRWALCLALCGVVVGWGATGASRATQLIAADGQPIGGQWQQWVDEMRVPTVAGRIVFYDDPAALCTGYAAGVEMPGACSRYGVVAVAPGILDRLNLYFELGHEFDWHYLTPALRWSFAWAWHDLSDPWFDSAVSLAAGSEDGLEADFAAIYSDCALGQNDKGGAIALWSNAPVAYPQINTCEFIDRIAERVGADMEATRFHPRRERHRLRRARA